MTQAIIKIDGEEVICKNIDTDRSLLTNGKWKGWTLEPVLEERASDGLYYNHRIRLENKSRRLHSNFDKGGYDTVNERKATPDE